MDLLVERDELEISPEKEHPPYIMCTQTGNYLERHLHKNDIN